VNISGIDFELRFCSSRSESHCTVGSGVLEDGVVSSDGLLAGFGLVEDGLLVSFDGLLVHGVGMISGSASLALVFISGILGLDSSFVGGMGSISSFVSVGFIFGSLLSGGVSGVEFFMGFVLFFLSVVEVVLSFGEFLLSVLELGPSLVPGFEGSRSVDVGSLEGCDSDLVVLDGSDLSFNGKVKLLVGEVVVCDGFLVGSNGSFPALVPSSTEFSGSGFLVLSLVVVVSSKESSFDESSVFLDKDGSSGHSFLEVTHGVEETFIGESGVGGGLGDNGEGCDDGDLGEHVGVVLIKLIITQYQNSEVNENCPIKQLKIDALYLLR
jgi:hypothetical protein